MLKISCNEFISMLASKEPIPGGGGASAYVGALGVALGSMVGNLTIGKKKYEHVEHEMRDLLRDSYRLQEELSELAMKDAEVFTPLAAAYKMPSETDMQREMKQTAIQDALGDAAIVPLQVAELCVEALKLLEKFAHKGSRMVVSDAGVGAAFCKAALLGAKFNVLINVKSMANEALKNQILESLEIAVAEGSAVADGIIGYVEEELA